MIRFLKLQPWKIFVLLILTPLLLIPSIESYLASLNGQYSFYFFLIAMTPLFITLAFWQYAVTKVLRQLKPERLNHSISQFYIMNVIRILVLIAIISLLYLNATNFSLISFLLLLPILLSFALINSRISSLTNKLIVSVELGKEAQGSDTYGLALLLKVFPLGIPIIHSRVRAIVLKNF